MNFDLVQAACRENHILYTYSFAVVMQIRIEVIRWSIN